MTDSAKMLILLDPSSGIPVYRQLMDQVKFLVTSGVLQPGDPLPSTRTLSTELGVNPMTISKAYSYLEREGVVERRPGLPLVVAQIQPQRLRERKLEQLRESLASPVAIVRQLGIERQAALSVFERMLDDAAPNPEKGEKNHEDD